MNFPRAASPHARSGRTSFWLAWVLALVAAVFIAPWFSAPPAPPPGQLPPTPANIWHLLLAAAPSYGIDPRFAYALAMAESSLDPYAFNHGARGLLQLRPAAWETVSDEPFHEAWNWEKNTRASLAYLAWCQNFLTQHHALSPPLLAACYHFGPDAVSAANFDLQNLPHAPNDIYRQLFAGDRAPVPAPTG